jgi:LysM repeat protein
MSRATVQPGQTLADIAVQHLGSEEGVYELARLNGLEVTSDIEAGQELLLPAPGDRRALAVMRQGGYQPAAEAVGAELTNLAPLRLNLKDSVGDPGIVLPGQTLPDIAVQWLGSEEAVFELAQLNGLTQTSPIEPGQKLKLPAAYDLRARRDFARGGWQPASGLEQILEGIEIWAIELDFVVQ